ncbi:MAG TPA: hypothetical protein ENN46_00995 [Candidatus Woesearchaeota archaeon]|nr:hypothetical protein [Candidatus Woesearchaeota archaeon]
MKPKEKKSSITKAGKALIDFIKNNKIFVFLFLFSTSYFLYQNITTISWDLSVYVLNAQYWFSDGFYFETLRPPVAPLLIAFFNIFSGWGGAELLYIIFTSGVFAFSIYKFSRIARLNHTGLYALSLSFYVLLWGLSVGTELLSLAFLILATAYIISSKPVSGLFLGLSAMTRYAALGLFPILLFHFNLKRIGKSLLLFFGVVFLWLLYNYFAFGNFLESIANQYALNVLFRQDVIQPVNLRHFLEVQNILIPFFILGLAFVIYKLIKEIASSKKDSLKSLAGLAKKRKTELLMFALLIASIYSYASTPTKLSRYLFFLVFPTIYFGYLGIKGVISFFRIPENGITYFCAAIFVLNLGLLIEYGPHFEREEPYQEGIQILEELNLTHCTLRSNAWPIVNYLGIPASPYPRQEVLKQSLEAGEILLLYTRVGEPEYVFDEIFLEELPTLYKGRNIYVLGEENCKEWEGLPYTETYLQRLRSFIYETKGHEININPCFIMFQSYGLLEKGCNLIHGKGFIAEDKHGNRD